jgi:hypothetical protein
MPHPMFSRHVRELDRLKAERLLDAAQAATAQFQKAEWWDGMLARARGVASEIVAKVGPLFTFNGHAINTSGGLRRAFSEHVATRVDA